MERRTGENMRKVKYTEPSDYIPESIRKELKLGEYAVEETGEEIRSEKESHGECGPADEDPFAS